MTTFTQRISNLAGTSAKAKVLSQNDNDVVIVAAVRSAVTKVSQASVLVLRSSQNMCAQAKKGGFKDTRPEEILSEVLRAVYTKAGLDPALIEDVSVGNVLPPAGGASAARMAALAAGIPNTSAVNTVNRQCSSGLTSVTQIANEISTGQIDIGIGAFLVSIVAAFFILTYGRVGAGVESMTFGYGPRATADGFSEKVLACQEAEDCLIPMGITSENVASDYGISRAVQDEFAAKSFQKAAAAQKAGKFKDEILPITVKWVDPKTEKETERVIDQDDGIRDGVTAQSLAKLKPAFKEDGTTHAGKFGYMIFEACIDASYIKVTPLKYLTALLQSSSPAARSQNASDSR